MPKGQARKVARAKIRAAARDREFSDWRGAKPGPARTYHMKNAGRGPEYLPSAYVFSVEKRGDERGYVTVGAQESLPPVVEYSKADPPRQGFDRARATARGRGASTGDRLIYQGGVQYGVEASDGSVVNLRNGRAIENNPGVDPEGVAAGQRLTRDRWGALDDALSDSGLAGGTGLSGIARAVTGSGVSPTAVSAVASTGSSDNLWWTPCWTEHDDGGADSTEVGPGDDEWGDWDGCVPVAASMVIGHHEWVSESNEEERERIIDRLHWTMNTTDDGLTKPWDIDNGFQKYDEGWHDYDAQNIYLWNHPDFVKSEISDHYRPFLLNMWHGGEAEDRYQNYGDHTVTVVGYENDGDTLVLHDTWDDEDHRLSWGSWWAASYTKVTTS